MKKIIFPFFAATILMACTKDSDRTSVTVTESNAGFFELSAAYSTQKIGRVQQAIHNHLSPKTIFVSERDQFQKEVKLADGTHFFIKTAAGNLSIKFDKHDNSTDAYLQMKKLYAAVSEAVK